MDFRMNYDQILSDRIKDVQPSGIRKYFDLLDDSYISLGVGEPDFPTPERIRRAAIEKIKGRVAYTSNSGDPHLRELILRYLDERYGGEIPDSREALESLPGVGRKTANVVLNVVFHRPTMPVDTHLLRIAPRIGLSDGKTPLQVENDLLRVIPEEYLEHAHHWLILHGR